MTALIAAFAITALIAAVCAAAWLCLHDAGQRGTRGRSRRPRARPAGSHARR